MSKVLPLLAGMLAAPSLNADEASRPCAWCGIPVERDINNPAHSVVSVTGHALQEGHSRRQGQERPPAKASA